MGLASTAYNTESQWGLLAGSHSRPYLDVTQPGVGGADAGPAGAGGLALARVDHSVGHAAVRAPRGLS